MKKTFSVVIPTFNNESTLPTTVESVLAQSFQNFEIIVSNDGGRDPSEFLQFRDSRLQIVNLPQNSGVSSARNAGFAQSSGEYIYFLDSDDVVAPDLLSSMVKIIRERNPATLVFGHLTFGEADVEAGRKAIAVERRSLECEKLTPLDFYRSVRDRNGLFIPSGALFQREQMLDLLGPVPWRNDLRNSQDTLLFLQMGAIRPVLLCNEKFFVYVVRGNSLSSNKIASWSGRLRTMEIIEDWLAERNCDPRLIRLSREMRHTAARRVSRMYRASGQREVGRKVLLDDLRYGFNWKSAAALLQQYLSLR